MWATARQQTEENNKKKQSSLPSQLSPFIQRLLFFLLSFFSYIYSCNNSKKPVVLVGKNSYKMPLMAMISFGFIYGFLTIHFFPWKILYKNFYCQQVNTTNTVQVGLQCLIKCHFITGNDFLTPTQFVPVQFSFIFRIGD